MSHLDYQLEILRGQIEELQGRFEEMFALRRGSGAFGSLRGRSRRMRGKARQAYARARYGFLGMKPRLSLPSIGRQQPEPPMARLSPLALVAIAVIVTAVFFPNVLNRVIEQISGRMSQMTDPTNAARTSSEL
jgi:hypothetical protein